MTIKSNGQETPIPLSHAFTGLIIEAGKGMGQIRLI